MAVFPYEIEFPVIKSGSTYKFKTHSEIEYEVRFARKKNNLLLFFPLSTETHAGWYVPADQLMGIS